MSTNLRQKVTSNADVSKMNKEELKTHVRSYLNSSNVLDESSLPSNVLNAGSDEVLKHLEAKGNLTKRKIKTKLH